MEERGLTAAVQAQLFVANPSAALTLLARSSPTPGTVG
jgi:hypothetical protein